MPDATGNQASGHVASELRVLVGRDCITISTVAEEPRALHSTSRF